MSGFVGGILVVQAADAVVGSGADEGPRPLEAPAPPRLPAADARV